MVMDLSRLSEPDDTRECRIELDTRADTCVAGKNFRLVEATGEKVDVSPFSDEYEAIGDVPIGTVETAYTCPETGETVLLVGHQHLYFGDRMNHSLWNPNQLRHFDAKVYDCPKQFDLESPFMIELKDDEENIFTLPLKLNGIIQYLDTHYPTDEELETCRRIVYTSDAPWNPYSSNFEANEAAAHTYNAHRIHQLQALNTRTISALSTQEQPTFLSDMFADIQPDVSNGDSLADGDSDPEASRQVSAISTDHRQSVITPEELARHWGIGLESAANTLEAMTQAGIRRMLHPVDH